MGEVNEDTKMRSVYMFAEKMTVAAIVVWMRENYPQNRHAQEWADAIERREWKSGTTDPEGA